MSDRPRQLEHSHADLTKLVSEVGETLRGHAPEGLSPAMQRRRLTERLKQLGDELVRYFAQEEEQLLPFVRANVPAKLNAVELLVDAHDAMCGAIVRLVHLVDGMSGDPAALSGHFSRFEATYALHSRDEMSLFEELGETLSESHRQKLAEILRGL